MLRRSWFVATFALAACPSPPPIPATPIAGGALPVGTPSPRTENVPPIETAPTPHDEAPAAELDAPFAALLAAHNRVRAEHCAAPLAWSPALAQEAAAWARSLAKRGCAFEHSTTEHGENLAAGTEGALGPDDVVAMWAGEVSAYDWKKPRFGMKTGHFTQVVWKDTTQVGCGTATCKGLEIWVCNYDPAGNVDGEFRDNVARAGCK